MFNYMFCKEGLFFSERIISIIFSKILFYKKLETGLLWEIMKLCINSFIIIFIFYTFKTTYNTEHILSSLSLSSTSKVPSL